MQKISERLMCIADMVKPCGCMADIGTDHAYVPIYLCMENKVKTAIAGDVSKGSAEKARQNVELSGLNERISVRLGSGITILKKEDKADCIVIAGMGGMLMCDILKNGDITGVLQLVLQPQKDIPEVRRFVHSIGFKIEDEKMLCEDNKFYNIISAVRGGEEYTDTEYEFGKILISKKDKTLKAQLEHEIKISEALLPKVNEKRKQELEAQLLRYKEVLGCL